MLRKMVGKMEREGDGRVINFLKKIRLIGEEI